MGVVEGEMMALAGTPLDAVFCTSLKPKTKVLWLEKVKQYTRKEPHSGS